MATLVEYHPESPYEPESHAAAWVGGLEKRSGVCVVYGLGHGYHINELIKANPDCKFLIYEPNPKLNLMRCRDHNPDILTHPKVAVAFNWRGFRGALGAMKERFSGQTFLALPAYRQAYAKNYDWFIKRLAREVHVLQGDLITSLRFGREWQRNITQNFKHCLTSYPVSRLFGNWQGKPAAVISAGPTLERDIEHFNELKEKALLVAVGTVAPLLTKKGLSPHFYMAFDGGWDNYRAHFRGIKDLGCPIILDPIIHPRIAEQHTDRILMRIWPGTGVLVDRLGYDPGHIEIGPSVSNSIVNFLRLLQADPIIFVGQDLSFVKDQTHAKGTNIYKSEDYEVRRTPEGKGYFTAFTKGVGAGGKDVKMSWSWDIFLNVFERQISESSAKFWNCSLEGAKIEGAEDVPIQEVISRLPASIEKDYELLLLNARKNVPFSGMRIQKHLQSSLTSGLRLLERLKQPGVDMNQEFGNPDYNAYWFALQLPWWGCYSGQDNEVIRIEAMESVKWLLPYIHAELEKIKEINHARAQAEDKPQEENPDRQAQGT